MGNTVVWKPASTAAYSRLVHDAAARGGRAAADGVINLVYGSGAEIGDPVLASPRPRRRPLHRLDRRLQRRCGRRSASNIDRYRNYPRIVGETGGKDFIVAHPSADVDALATAIVRGAFEYQGQKCSRRVARVRAVEPLAGAARAARRRRSTTLKMGDVTDFSNFMGAVIDGSSFKTQKAAIDEAKASNGDASIARRRRRTTTPRAGSSQPTVIETTRPGLPADEGGALRAGRHGVRLRREASTRRRSSSIDRGAPYGLTGAVFARDRSAIEHADEKLRYAAGNFYVNDKPTGAVVGQQPFGGARASGHERQGRLDVEPDPLGLARGRSRRRSSRRRTTATRSWARSSTRGASRSGPRAHLDARPTSATARLRR